MIRRPAMLNERKESRASFIVLCVIFVIVLIIVILDLLRIFCLMTIEIKGDSMLDTLYGGERVLVDGTVDYEGGDIVYAVRGNRAERGDIVIIDTTDSSAYDPDGHAVFTASIIVKRLIAVEGDCVKCEQGVVYLNRAGSGYAPLAESYVRGTTPDFRKCASVRARSSFWETTARSARILRTLSGTDTICLPWTTSWALYLRGRYPSKDSVRHGKISVLRSTEFLLENNFIRRKL